MALTRRRTQTRRRLIAAAVSGGLHAAALAAVMLARPALPPPLELPPMAVELVTPPPRIEPPPEIELPAPEPEPAPRAAAPAPPTEPPPPRVRARPTPAPPPEVETVAAAEESSVYEGDANAEVSEAEAAGAGTASSGRGGGACNMTERLQEALRGDRQVRAALAEAYRGRALRVWDGDWVRHAGQEGAGLAAVREAIMWEVGFAPEACRHQRMRGLILISLSDSPGGARIVVGSPSWRWSDLLFHRGARRPAG